MLQQILHKIGSITLAFIVLFSSFSFTVHEHICGGEIADTSFFLEADSCEINMEICENTPSNVQRIKQEPCCNNHSEIIKGVDNNQQAQTELTLHQIQFVTTFVTTYIYLFNQVKTTPLFNDYSPPLVVKNIHKLDEIYLI